MLFMAKLHETEREVNASLINDVFLRFNADKKSCIEFNQMHILNMKRLLYISFTQLFKVSVSQFNTKLRKP